jgi:vacuolar-type H+-ATPase subunit D/Vma8|tara:strand:+ start:343 stop:495 length:153 start_codon:yes stop_codon:yes gene_type:complete
VKLAERITVVEVQLEERWKETIIRIKRIEAILIGTAGTIIVLLAGMLWKL